MKSSAPVYDVDFYSDDFVRNPWPHYAEMRQLGPVVWLPQHENFALTQHAEVSAALRDHAIFISGDGVAADAKANEITRGNSAASDGERHTAIRSATAPPLLPGALEKIRGEIDIAAADLIDRLAGLSRFETMKELAPHLPLTIVRDMVGLPDFGRENMLRWANATFDLLGVQNERGRAAIEVFLEQRKFAQSQARPEALKPGSWTRHDDLCHGTTDLPVGPEPRPMGPAACQAGAHAQCGKRSGADGVARTFVLPPYIARCRDRPGHDT
ncbi:MAG: hypothetical protein P8Z80_04270 [Pseudolabrys sp.]